ncbi:MAG: molybdopterin containing oxidoreductase [Hyphomicrobium sp.]|nr:MAG: molybdopterin containing oxidoreductase [Hyphomicrobium sp.]
MTKTTERSIDELFSGDPERADAVVFGRRTDATRRGFLGGAGIAAVGAAVGATIPFATNMPAGLVPAALAQDKSASAPTGAAAGPQFLEFPGKDKGLVVIGDKPLVAETPEHLLDDDTTPYTKLFIRNNGIPPEAPTNPDSWKLTIDGEVNKTLEVTLGELKARGKPRKLRMVLECGGNGRSFYTPAARGNQWTNGGAGCPEWTGLPLRDLLEAAGLKSSAVYTAHYGADVHLSGDASKETLSRGVRIPKALDEHTLLVWAMNGEPLPAIHGGPLRLVVPGWAGSASHKWLKRIWIRDKEHDGSGMGGTSYRLPIKPMVPGAKADPNNFKVMESMPVRSVISSPMNGAKFAAGTSEVALRGAAWAGDLPISKVDVSIDFGSSWAGMSLAKTTNPFDWTRWSGKVRLPSDGYYEVWVRATDGSGKLQPHVAPNWNPSGYGGNPMHRIAVLVG